MRAHHKPKHSVRTKRVVKWKMYDFSFTHFAALPCVRMCVLLLRCKEADFAIFFGFPPMAGLAGAEAVRSLIHENGLR